MGFICNCNGISTYNQVEQIFLFVSFGLTFKSFYSLNYLVSQNIEMTSSETCMREQKILKKILAEAKVDYVTNF